MKSIKELFVTYDIALAMKELGFDEHCLAHYYSDKYYDLIHDCENVMEGDFVVCSHSNSTKAPLWQQCMDWL